MANDCNNVVKINIAKLLPLYGIIFKYYFTYFQYPKNYLLKFIETEIHPNIPIRNILFG